MENSINKVYQLDLVVLTPLHAGAGAEKDLVKGLDFVQNKGLVYILNQKKILNEIDISSMSSILLKKDEVQLINKLAGKLDQVSDATYEMAVTSDNDIKSFFRNGLSNKPVLPGSSLKGAIRSILFAYLKTKGQDKEDDVFGKASVGDTFMRFIKVSDVSFDHLKLSNTKIFNLQKVSDSWQGAWKHGNQTDARFKATGFNTLYEVLPPKAASKVTISIADKTFDNFEINNRHKFGNKKEEIVHQPIEFLFQIINKHTAEYIRKEIAFYNKYPNNETDGIIKSLKHVLSQIPEDNSWCILKMSAGSGFHSITGDWKFDDYINQPGLWTEGRNLGKKKYKSRKIAIGSSSDEFQYAPMGFIKIGRKSEVEKENERLEVEAIAESERQKTAERLRIEQQKEDERIELLRKQEEEQLHIETERLQKEAEEKRFQEEKIEAERLKLEADEKARLERLSQKIEGGLAFLANSKDFDDAKRKVDDWLLKAKVDLLPENQNLLLVTALTRFYNDPKNREKKKWAEPFAKSAIWKKISAWIGPDLANDWYNEIIK
jgi:CRISPR/Cas system CSM-associated protein Csm5 (group 7 of RAMP superfamily)